MSNLAFDAADRRSPMNDAQRYEQLAEAAYDAMYRAGPPYSAKTHYEDAAANISKAVAAARKAGAQDEAARLTARLDHIRAVYDSQFRGL
jgi:hypothetical protein